MRLRATRSLSFVLGTVSGLKVLLHVDELGGDLPLVAPGIVSVGVHLGLFLRSLFTWKAEVAVTSSPKLSNSPLWPDMMALSWS